MAENLYRALWSWLICVSVTVVVSFFTAAKPAAQLTGLVYGYTDIPGRRRPSLLQASGLLGNWRRYLVCRIAVRLLVTGCSGGNR